MRLLVLGGTAWLGRALVDTALELGHAVTCLARGAAGSPPGGAHFVLADRDEPGAYDAVSAERWDVVLDVSRQPGHVRRAVAALEPSSGTFVLISSGNVYADHRTVGGDESTPLLQALESDVMADMSTYGEAKVACEQAVMAGFGPGRSLIARAGLIGGPGDPFDRGGYWPLRFARPATSDGRVLVPDAPHQPTQLIDVRDVARWIVEAGTGEVRGAFNATGPTVPLREHLEAARAVADHTGRLVAAPEDWLAAQGVEPWMGPRSLPLWLPDPDYGGFSARDSGRARAAGLRTRPLEQTLADTLAWELTRDLAAPRRAGLSDDEELDLLALLERG